MKTSEVLYAAAGYIRERGWIQGSFGEHGRPRCMDGALMSAGCRAPWINVDSYLDRVCGCASMEFNDKQCKTANEAIAALEIAADIAFAEGQ